MKLKRAYIRTRTFLRPKISLSLGFLCFLLLLLSLLNINPTQAAINNQINFQARVLNSSGGLIPDGDYNLRFRIYSGGDGQVGGGDETLAWTETYSGANQVTVKNGYVSVKLNSINADLSSVDFSDSTLWLSVEVGGTSGTPAWDGEMDPMMRFTSVPYAFNAERAETAITLSETQGANTGTLAFDTLTASQTILLPDGSGTVCLSGSSSCGFASGSGSAILQGGNSFGANMLIGTDDTYDLIFKTNAVTRLTISSSGAATFTDAVTALSFSGDGSALTDLNATNITSGTLSIDRLADGSITNAKLTNNSLGVNSGSGIAGGGVITLGGSRTLALGNLTEDWVQAGGFDIILDNAGSELRILESSGDTFYGEFDVADLSADRLYTFPDVSGDVTVLGQVIENAELANDSITISTSALDSGISGGGLVALGGTLNLSTTLGEDVDTSEIEDGTLLETDLSSTNAPTDDYILSYDQASGGFTWVNPSAGGQLTEAEVEAYIFDGDNTGTLSSGTLDFNSLSYLGVLSDAQIADALTVSASGTVADGALSANVSLLGSSIELGTETTGNYVATLTAGNGLSGDGTGVGSTPTVSLGDFTANWTQAGAFDLILDNADSELQMLDSGGTYYGIFDVGSLSANETYSFLAGGDVLTSGNVASYATTGVTAGAGLAGGGTTGLLTLDIGAGNGISVNANDIAVLYGATAATAVEGNTQITVTAGTGLSGGGTITLGSGGSVSLNSTLGTTIDTSEIDNGTILEEDLSSTNAPTNDYVLTFDQTSGGFTWADPATLPSSGVSSLNSLNGSLSLLGTSNQISVADNGTNAITLSLPQDIATSSSVEFAGGTFSGNLSVQGGTTTLGTVSQAGSLVLHDGNGQTTTLSAGDSGGNLSFTLPNTLGSSTQCLKTDGSGGLSFANCNNGSGPNGSVNLQDAYDTGNTIVTSDNRNIAFTLSDTTTDSDFIINLAGTGNVFDVQDGGASVLTVSDGNNISLSGLVAVSGVIQSQNALSFEGATQDGFETTLAITDPTADRTITVPNDSGTICLTSGNCSGVGGTGDILQNGNSFTALMTLGTNDNFGFAFETNGVERARFDTDGDFGIGLTNPSYKLDVSGGTGIVGRYSGRVIGGDAVNSNEFVTKSQLDGATGGGTKVASLNTLSGDLNLQGTANQVIVADNGTDTITLSLPQDIATSSNPTFATLNTGQGANELYAPSYYAQQQDATLLNSTDDLNSLSDGWYAWSNSNPTNAPRSYMTMVQQTDGIQKIQMAFGGSSYGDVFVRRADSGTFYAWTRMWNASNDGSGSGLDADLLDGNSSAFFQNAGNINAGTLANARLNTNVSLLGQTIEGSEISSSTVTNSNLVNDSITITAGTGLTGGGAVALGGSVTLNSSLGTSIDSSEIVDGTIQEVDLESINGPTDGYVLSYDSGSGGFEWVAGAGGGLFTDAGSFAYLTATTDDLVLGSSTVAGASLYFDESASNLYLGTDGSANGTLTLYNSAGSTPANINTNASGDLNLSSPSGTVVVGDGSGDIQLQLDNQADTFAASKSAALSSAYSDSDYAFTRSLTNASSAHSFGGRVLSVSDTSAATAGTTVNYDLMFGNAAPTGASFTGNLLRLQTSGADRFVVDASGNTNLSGDLTVTGANLILGTTNLSETDLDALDNGSIESSEITNGTITGTDVASSTITNSNLVNSSLNVNTGSGLSGGGNIALGGSATLSLSNLTADWTQSGAFDITLNNAGSELRMLESAGGTYYGTLDVGDLGSDQTFTFLQGGTVLTSGNVGSYATTGVTAGNGLINGGTTGVVTLNVGAGTGVTVAADAISVNYGATAGTAVQGNTQITVTASTGLSGGGSITLGSGGSVSLSSTLGTSISSGEIVDGTIQEIDMEITNAPTNDYVLTYDSATGGFTWVDGSTASGISESVVESYIFDADNTGTLSSGTLALNSLSYTGTLSVSYGGTGLTSAGAAGSIAYSNGTGFAFNAAGTSGQCLLSNGTGAPSWGDCGGSGGPTTLQVAYDNGSSITTTDARDITFNLADTTTDSSFIVNLQGTANLFDVQNNGTSVLTADTNGRVGIGDNTPTYKLDVAGTGRFTNDLLVDGNTTLGNAATDATTINGQVDIQVDTGGVVLNSANANPYSFIEFQNGGAARTVLDFGASTTEDFRILAGSGTAGAETFTEALRVANSGNVGIGGATTPASPLTVNGSVVGNDGILRVSGPNRQIVIEDTDDSQFGQLSFSSGAWAFRTNDSASTPILWLDSNSNVGLGTTTPDATLDIHGGLVVGSTSPKSTVGENIQITGSTSDAILGVQDGNGRVQLKWNATSGVSETYLTSSEPAFFWDMTVTGSPIWEMKYAGGGTAGSPISWSTLLSLSSAGDLTTNGDLTVSGDNINFGSGEAINTGTDFQLTSNSGYFDMRPNDGTHGIILRDFTGGTTAWGGIRVTSAGTIQFSTDGSSYSHLELKDDRTLTVSTPGSSTGSSEVSITSPNSAPGLIINSAAAHRADIRRTDFGLYLLASGSSTAPAWTDGVSIRDGGNVGIKTNSPSQELQVAGDVLVDNYIAFVGTATNSPTLCYANAGGGYQIRRCGSLRKLKTNISDLNIGGLDTINSLTPRQYNWKEGGRFDLGFIAEEVEAVNPVLAEYGGKNGELSSVKYRHMVALTVQGIQELDIKIEDLKSQINSANYIQNNQSAQLSGLNVSGSTTLNNLTVKGAATFQKSIAVKGNITLEGKILSKTNTAPAVVVDELIAGTGSTANVDGTDVAGTITVQSGTVTDKGSAVEITFNKAYTEAPRIVISGLNEVSALSNAYIEKTNQGFSLVFPNKLTEETTYKFDYVIIGSGINTP